ncbi:MAG: A/G-specific adenine glycosylase [Bdellovibrionales bacterium]
MVRSVKVRCGKVKRQRGLALAAPDPATLLDWYDLHRRRLPWRTEPGETPDPYRVWLSEIMLQQTTVAAAGPYFEAFVARWPTVQDIAAAPLEEVLRGWAGLGYYRRARLLHACAKAVSHEHGGAFPRGAAVLRLLPGIGPYTAGAIAAIAFDARASAVDGNVERVMARVYALEEIFPFPKAKSAVRKLADALLPESRCGDYAQALMDLGATVCTPRSPDCGICPWHDACRAAAQGQPERYPRKAVKAGGKPLRRGMAFALFSPDGALLLRKRPDEGLLGGMMEVPSSPWREGGFPELAHVLSEAPGPQGVIWHEIKPKVKHVFTHFDLEIAIAVGRLSAPCKPPYHCKWVAPQHLAQEALPSVMRKIAQAAIEALYSVGLS